MNFSFEKLLAFLRVSSRVAGLEVNDQVLRLAYFDKAWQLEAIKLEPGILEEGKIKNRAGFVAALQALKTRVLRGHRRNRTMSVVLCLSSLPIYTQTFSLPMITGENFVEAVELNLKMASPFEEGKSYSGWQLLGRNETTLQGEVLSAFIERQAVDDVVGALFDAGFLTMAVESRALALARIFRDKGAGVDVARPYIFANIDNSGLEFLIIRNGGLYFEYRESWRDLMGEKGEISIEKFEEVIAASTRQVMNFYDQHWHEPVSAVIISATAFEEEAEKAIASVVSLPTVRLTLVLGQTISSEWLAALGAGLRGHGVKTNDREVNLLGDELQDRFRGEQILTFMEFWRVVIPVVFGILLLTFGSAIAFLVNAKAAVKARSDFNLGAPQNAEIALLEASAQEFNRAVVLISAAQQSLSPRSSLLTKLTSAASANSITINHIRFHSFSNPITLSGGGRMESDIVAFKAALLADPSFQSIDIPLTGLQTTATNVSFTMTFVYTPSGSGS